MGISYVRKRNLNAVDMSWNESGFHIVNLNENRTVFTTCQYTYFILKFCGKIVFSSIEETFLVSRFHTM